METMIRYLDEIDVSGKRIFLRVDFNVPLDKKGEITDDHRIRAALPSIRYALDEGASLIVASHLGRPRGKRVPELSLAPVAARLSQIIGVSVEMAPDCVGSETESMAAALRRGQVLLLENLRYHGEEQANDPGFAGALASLAQVYVNDAFAVSHRAHASVVGVPSYLGECAAGFLLKNEITYFEKAMKGPERPLLAILGGAKVSSKLGAIENILPRVDKMIIGGAMANTFLLARGLSVGKSLIEPDLVETAVNIMKLAGKSGTELLLPVDCVVTAELSMEGDVRIVKVSEIPPDMMVADIGPETTDLFKKAVSDAATLIWNGPMGAFEMERFSKGTMELAHAVGSSSALSIIGGGDTDLAINRAGEAANVSYMSTGGGAFLMLLEGRDLPGFKALEECGTAQGL